MSSVCVVCWIFLQTFQTYFCIQANSVDPDQTDLGPHCLQKWLLKSQAVHSFVEIDHEIFSMVILSLPLIQEGQLSVSGERMCTVLVNRLED